MERFALAALASALILAGCASAPGKGLPPLNGMIYDADNKPVAEAAISIDGDRAATSDIQGHFTLPRLKQGKEYALEAEKKGYETNATTFSYTNATQVLYLRMTSGEQLVDEAERAITSENWSEAASFLDRAEAAGCDSLASGYLRAVLLAGTGNYSDAAATLEKLRSAGANEPFLDLYLADLYQYRLSLPDRAAEALQRYLTARSDLDAEKRLRDLSGGTN